MGPVPKYQGDTPAGGWPASQAQVLLVSVNGDVGWEAPHKTRAEPTKPIDARHRQWPGDTCLALYIWHRIGLRASDALGDGERREAG